VFAWRSSDIAHVSKSLFFSGDLMPLHLAMFMACILSFFLACIPPEKDSTDTATDSNVVVIDTDPPPGTDADEDGYTAEDGDCNDNNADVHPGATEICNGLDDDCDGSPYDDGAVDAVAYWQDVDGDGYGDSDLEKMACEQLVGWVTNRDDCNDANPDINPKATEVCDGIDNNCDGVVDEDSASDAVTWYSDADGDGHGDSGRFGTQVTACTPPSGYADNNNDCDDTNSAMYPGTVEACDGFDNDCDGDVDNLNVAQASQGSLWYPDADSDGYGGSPVKRACSQPAGYLSTQEDCDDLNPDINNGAQEICDGFDNDCDGLADDMDSSVTGQSTWYADLDGDHFGDPNSSVLACVNPGAPYMANNLDCDDTDVAISPVASEIWYDGIDQDCDGLSDYDQDGDGYDAYVYGGNDCYDTDPARQMSLSCGG